MGGKSSSSSSKSTSASTQNLNAQGNTAPVVVPSVDVDGGKYTTATVNQNLSKKYDVDVRNTVTDFGAVQGALELSMKAIDNYEKINERAINEIVGANGGVLEFAGNAIDQVAGAMRSDDAENYNNLIKWVVVGSVLIVGVGAFKK